MTKKPAKSALPGIRTRKPPQSSSGGGSSVRDQDTQAQTHTVQADTPVQGGTDGRFTSNQRTERNVPTGGFTGGVEKRTLAAELRNHYRERPAEANGDRIDQEITAALEEGRPVNMANAFPYHSTPPGVQAAAEPHIGMEQTVPLQPVAPSDATGDDDASPGTEPPGLSEAASPRTRMAYIERHHSHYATEYSMVMVHRMTLRGLPVDQIAAMMNKTSRSILYLREKMHERLAEEAKYADIYGIAGQTMAFYNEVRALSMRLATDSKNSTPERLNAMRIAMNAEADKHRFLQASRFYDHAPYVPQGNADADTASDDAQALKRLTRELLEGPDVIDEQGNAVPEQDNDDIDGVMMLGGISRPKRRR